MVCEKCNTNNGKDATTCVKCGSLLFQFKKCPGCDFGEIPQYAKFCPTCRFDFVNNQPAVGRTNTKSSSRSVFCLQCKSEIDSEVHFCQYCGAISQLPEYIDESMREQYQKSLFNFFDQVNQTKDKYKATTVINETISAYDRQINLLKELCQTHIEDNISSELIRRMDLFSKQCNSNEFHIALVGAVKAGKSTLINAILNRNLASTDVTPETAALTKFRASEQDYVKVTFYNTQEWNALWNSVQMIGEGKFLDEFNQLGAESEKKRWINQKDYFQYCISNQELKEEIRKWTSSKSAVHYFVKEVEIGITNFQVPKNVIFVDTPGLNDPVAYRSDVTRNYISRANVVLVCVEAKILRGDELETIYRVFANTKHSPHKVYIIGTQYDILNSPVDDWVKNKELWIQYFSKEGCFGSVNLAQKQIIAASAYLYSLATKFNDPNYVLSEDESVMLLVANLKFKITSGNSQSEISEMQKRYSHIEDIKDLIFNEPIINADKLIIQDLCEKYKDLKLDIRKSADKTLMDNKELLDNFNKSVNEIHLDIQNKKQSIEQEQVDAEKFKKELLTFFNRMKQEANKLSKEMLQCVNN